MVAMPALMGSASSGSLRKSMTTQVSSSPTGSRPDSLVTDPVLSEVRVDFGTHRRVIGIGTSRKRLAQFADRSKPIALDRAEPGNRDAVPGDDHGFAGFYGVHDRGALVAQFSLRNRTRRSRCTHMCSVARP